MLDFKEFKHAERALCFFEEFSKIPHGSGNVAALADYLVNFAIRRGLFYTRDKSDNVIIRKPATKGYESRPTVIFQGHIDMVAEKKPSSDKNMEKEGLELYIDGDFLRAKDTTLGGDDGVAIAYALAILDASDIEHPEFEAIFTSDEEIGLIGAAALDTSVIKGNLLINIDSDVEGVFTVGCAGGLRMDANLPIQRENYGKYFYKLDISGLQGGHSGIEIDKGRLNAITELTDALTLIDDARIISIDGGNMDNAIPRFASCSFATKAQIDNPDFLFKEFLSEKRNTEKDIALTLTEIKPELLPFSKESHDAFVLSVKEANTGVVSMSKNITGLVETSKNLGILATEKDTIKLSYSLRSSDENEKAKMKTALRKIWESAHAKVSERGEYPAWEYKKDSHLRDTMCRVYREMYKKDAEVITIHAGLECGIFSNKIPGLDCVSIGPDNFDIHTTEERLSLSSFERVWLFLLAVLKNI